MSIHLKYLANTAFHIQSSRHSILIDTFFEAGPLPFSDVPRDTYAQILAAEGEFSGVDIVLVTHKHWDHCDVRRLLEYRKRDVVFLVPGDVMNEELEDDGRFTVVPPEGGAIWDRDGLRITAIPTHHDGEDSGYPIEHFAYLLEFTEEERALLFLGDSRTEWEVIHPAIDGKKIDLLALNFVEINQERGRGFIQNVGAGKTLLCHLPLPADDRYHVAKLAKRNLLRQGDAFSSVGVCDETGIELDV